LFYQVDRFSEPGDAHFYGTGAYRDVCSRFNGVTHTIAQVQSDQLSYANRLVRVLAGYIAGCTGGKLLDVGGSAGIVAREFVNHFDLRGTVLDPASDEVSAARALGLEAVTGSVESWETQDKFDLILLCRSIEHLFDVGGALRRIRTLLTPGGLFYCDIADFMEMCRLVGPPETFTKIDHCYWLTQSTALQIFASLGFKLISMNIVFGYGQVGFLLQACEPQPIPATHGHQLQQQIEEIQDIERAWRQFGTRSTGTRDWLMRKAYRAKRKLERLMLPDRQQPVSTGATVSNATPETTPRST
jgi:SAM-dependent methyltransferase